MLRVLHITAAAALAVCGVATAATPAPIAATLQADQPGVQINRNVYGQFAEHLGTGIYGGVWVGEDSKIPNTRGYRNDVLKALRDLKVPQVRWPGGCFADEYHWREGIGPRDKRPVRVNTHWGGVEEPNSFGTHEFFEFAELIGAEPYLAGNVGAASPDELASWVEYVNSDTKSTLANERRANGREQPWKLPFVGVGNELWGCGGNMRVEYAADVYRRYQTFVKGPEGRVPAKIAPGANNDDYHWTEVMMRDAGKLMDGLSLHYYVIPGGWSHKQPATGFDENAWAETLSKALYMEELVTRHSAIMDRYDPRKKVMLAVDEWGSWYSPTPGSNPGFLQQQNSLRDALLAAVTLNVFHRHADRVRMANIAQMVNVLQAMILTEGDKMVLTPTYHVFKLYEPFQGATVLPLEISAPEYQHGKYTMPAVNGSAARGADGSTYLALSNLQPGDSARMAVRLAGKGYTKVSGSVLTAPAMDSVNDFRAPELVKPVPFKGAKLASGTLNLELPPKSVVVLKLE